MKARRRLTACLGLAVLLALAEVAAGQEPAEATIGVRYRSADTVYLDAGSTAGLTAGERLEVFRDGRVIAILEVVYLAEHSASARVVEGNADVRPGDRVRRLPDAAPPTPPRADEAPAPPPPEPPPPRRPVDRRAETRISGTVTFDWEGFSDGGEAARDWQRTALGLRLRGSDLGGLPLGVRVRLRASEVERDRAYLSGLVPESESRDRLYELALSWEPPEGRWALRAGRLGASPYAGIGYLDGALGEVRLAGNLSVGAFAGRRPVIEELGFDGDGSQVGGFLRLAPRNGAGDFRPWQLVVGGQREETDAGAFRDLLTVEGSWDGELWSVAEYLRWQAGGDLVGPGGAAVEEGTGLVDLALFARRRLAGGGGVTVSYDRLEPRPELDAVLEGPEELFVERLRQGLRFGWDGGGGNAGWRWSGALGLRRGEVEGVTQAEEESGDTVSLRLAARHPRLVGGLSFGVSATGFSAPDLDGLLVSLRSGHRFAGGHELELALGATGHRGLLEEERVSGWARLSGWAELPGNLFARAEAELAGGDDYEGLRLGLGLGYRM